jgi:hypothetical protein
MSQIEHQAEEQKTGKRKKTRKAARKRNRWLDATVVVAAIGGLSAIAVALIQDSEHPSTPSVNASANSAVAIGGNAVAISGNGNNSTITVNNVSDGNTREDKLLKVLQETGKIIDKVKGEPTNNLSNVGTGLTTPRL